MNLSALAYRLVRPSGSQSYFDGLYRIDGDPFSNQASRYDQRKRELLLTMVAKRRHRRALDAGCGNGTISRALVDLCDSVLGVDFSAEAINRAREISPTGDALAYAQADLTALAPEGRFDLVVCSEVLYYLSGAQLDAAVANLRECCAPDAWLVVALPIRHEARVTSRIAAKFTRTEQIRVRDWRRSYVVARWEPNPLGS